MRDKLHLSLFLAGLTLFTGVSWLAVVDNTGAATLWLLDKLVERYYLFKDRREGNRLRHEREQLFSEQKQKDHSRKPVRIEPVVKQVEQSERAFKEQQIPLFNTGSSDATLPSLSLLEKPSSKTRGYSESALQAMSRQLERTRALCPYRVAPGGEAHVYVAD